LSFKREHNDLLLFLLKQLVAEQLQFRRSRALRDENEDAADAHLLDKVDVPERDLVDKVCVVPTLQTSIILLRCFRLVS
jgi:DNA replication licensing factor MCM2